MPRARRARRAVLARIGRDGTIETTVSEVDDGSAASPARSPTRSSSAATTKRIKVHKQLVSATALTGGPYERERFDCEPAQG